MTSFQPLRCINHDCRASSKTWLKVFFTARLDANNGRKRIDDRRYLYDGRNDELTSFPASSCMDVGNRAALFTYLRAESGDLGPSLSTALSPF